MKHDWRLQQLGQQAYLIVVVIIVVAAVVVAPFLVAIAKLLELLRRRRGAKGTVPLIASASFSLELRELVLFVALLIPRAVTWRREADGTRRKKNNNNNKKKSKSKKGGPALLRSRFVGFVASVREWVRMFRNQYDTDVTTWSPAGRLHQVEYAMEAVKQGSAAIGLRSKTHVVLAAVNKASSELSSHQKKLFKIDNHIGIAMAGLTADGRVLSRYMRSECINHKFVYESPLPVGRLVVQVADKAQVIDSAFTVFS